MADETDVQPQASPLGIQPTHQVPADLLNMLPYSPGKRIRYGILWAAWTAVLAIGGLSELFGGQVLGGLVALVLAALAGRYDYRIWTWRARRLLFFIIW